MNGDDDDANEPLRADDDAVLLEMGVTGVAGARLFPVEDSVCGRAVLVDVELESMGEWAAGGWIGAGITAMESRSRGSAREGGGDSEWRRMVSIGGGG